MISYAARPCFVLFLFAVLLMLPAMARPKSAELKVVKGCVVVDLMPSYWKFWQLEEKLANHEKPGSFQKIVVRPNRAIYVEAFRGYFDSVESGKRIPKYLSQAKPLLEDMKVLSASWPKELEGYSNRFLKEFPDMQPFTIYMMPSLLTFNGKTGNVHGHMSMFVGVDWFAQRKKSNLAVLVDHELFHVYHSQVAPEMFSEVTRKQEKEMPLYKALWTEGLATYVSKKLNPDATLADVLMDENLDKVEDSTLAACAKQILENIESTSEGDYRKFFKYRPIGEAGEIPSRICYVVGLRVVERIAKNASLSQLAHTQGPELKQEIREALKQLN